ncbi:bifunctional riboflavin kinase/FAD synthetase [Arsenophonus symbiont of Ornithomya chloropus]|uniref:bifunctional riboflavin kinase/FAD synthetase n=1 Tax=Arsenophonus symbiont of Ornithomya chloropus TaxID=634121 RepID=UPI0032B0FD74
MKFIRGIYNIRKDHHGCVLTIGNFDSVHRGHQVLLKCLKKESHFRKLPTMVMIFEPQPLEFFCGKKSPVRLTPLRDKIRYFFEYGVDYLLCIKFNHKFASLTPRMFVLEYLVDKLGINFLAIGDDFRFGKDRKGDFEYLFEAGKQYGFTVANTKSFCIKGQRISSTAVRKALLSDNFVLAEHLMAHPYRLSGRIVHGRKLGTRIGFPTANLQLKSWVVPVKGVYIAEVYGLSKKPFKAVTNIGTRPTVNGIKQQIEIHLIDMYINIYGRYIDLVLRKKIREEKRFACINELSKQIRKDIIVAKEFFDFFNKNI